MTTQFDLRTERWILVRLHSGTIEEFSLHDVFRRSQDIRTIVGELPTQTFAIVRVLLAIVHRSLELDETTDPIEYWQQLWNLETLPTDLIEAYLDDFADRFDLLHQDTPFFQVANLHTAKNESSGLEKIIADVPNGYQFFATRTARGYARISFAEAARWLIHCQAFDPSGIKSGAIGDSRVKGGRGYPIGTGWAGAIGGILLEGRNLRETLLLNLVLSDENRNYRSGEDDVPAWEREPLTASVEDRQGRGPYGQIDLFTWQSRRIRLDHDGQAVTGVLIANGDAPVPQNQQNNEPMTAWRLSEAQAKKLGLPTVYMPRTHNPDRSLWRGLAALVPGPHSPGNTALAPPVLEWLGLLRDEGAVEEHYVALTHAIGIEYGSQSATVAEIIDDALSIHAVLVSEQGRPLAAAAVTAVSNTENAVSAAAFLAANLAIAAGGPAEGPRDRAREECYFRLDAPFRHWLSKLDSSTDIDAALMSWYDTARRTIWTVAQNMITSSGPTAWVGRENSLGKHVSTPQADSWFRTALGKALPRTDSNSYVTAHDHTTTRTAS